MEGLTRLACEVGMPSILILDQETSFMKMVKDSEINLLDIQQRSFTEHGIKFVTAPVAGHNFIGLTERKIRTVQETFEKMDLKSVRLHATGLQTFCKLVENQLNNTPLGYSYGRDANNTEILKIITPNMLKNGRLNSRSLKGPLKFPTGPADYLKKVHETFNAFYKIWNVSVVPKLIPQPKWYKSSPEVKVQDVIYFQKIANDLNSDWTVGLVDSVIRSKDGVVRRVTVKYHNHGDSAPKFTDRAVRSLVKLFNIHDNYFIEDMSHVEKLMSKLSTEAEGVANVMTANTRGLNKSRCPDTDASVEATQGFDKSRCADITTDVAPTKGSYRSRCECCCVGHCSMSHFTGAGRIISVVPQDVKEMMIHPDVDVSHDDAIDAIHLKSDAMIHDEFHMMLCALETKFDMDP